MNRLGSAHTLAWLGALVLCALTIFAYQPAWHGGFIWDDDRYVTHNHLLTEPDGLRRIWFSLDAPSQYFPLAYTVLRIERSLWDLQPTGYHWVNSAELSMSQRSYFIYLRSSPNPPPAHYRLRCF